MSKELRAVLTLVLIVAIIQFVACSFEMSPTSSQQQSGRDMSIPDDDVHENLGPNESCGTAAERSGCHGTTVIISE